jgi:hypothetical protein
MGDGFAFPSEHFIDLKNKMKTNLHLFRKFSL